MNERQLKEILYCLVYARFFAHGTDGHNSKIIIAQQAIAQGYRYAMGGDWFELWRNGEHLLNLTELPSWDKQ